MRWMGRHRFSCFAVAALVVAAVPSAEPELAAAATLRVGPDKPYRTIRSAALAVQNGDVVEVDARLYSGDVATWSKSNLTVLAVGGGRAQLRANGAAEAGKGIWVVSGANITLDGFEFSGAAVPDRNGAGIRAQGAGTLVVRNCYFHDNENGILGGADSLVVESSIFDHNGNGDGHTHNMYIDHGGSFTLRWSFSHRAVVGHNVKSRALRNYILYDRILDESDGTGSYSVDLPQGGRSYLVGNFIEQGPQSGNPAIVAYAAESASNGALELYVTYNTLVNDRTGGGTFLQLRSGTTATSTGNIFYGPGTTWSGGSSVAASRNHVAPALDNEPRFADPRAYDYRLTSTSPRGASGIVDAGADPGFAPGGFDLEPHFQYVYEAGNQTRAPLGSLDLGAFELGTPPSGAGPGGDDSDHTGGVRRLSAHPNPAPAGRTVVSFSIPARQNVRLRVFSMSGRYVATLADGEIGPGEVQVPWDATDHRGRRVASGKYVYRIETRGTSQSKSLLLVH